MTRKDFETIASIIRGMNDPDEISRDNMEYLTSCFVLGLRARFPQFNPAKFREACETKT